MIVQTAFKNFHRHIAGRSLYIVAISLLVMVSYASLTAYTDQHLQTLVNSNPMLISLLVLYVAILTFSLLIIFYANRFLLQQQHQEIGVQILSGLSRGQIARLFSYENLFGELIELGSGLILGMLFSKLYGMLLLRLMGVDAEINRWFSLTALWVTAVSFLAIFLIVALIDSARISQLKLVQLIYGRPNRSAETPPTLNLLLSCLGVGLLIASYVAVFKLNWFQSVEDLRLDQPSSFALYFIGASLFLGVWLMYRNVLPTVLEWMRHRSWAFSRRHLLDFAVAGQKFHQHYQSLSLTTLFVTASIVMLGSAAAIYAFETRSLQEEVPIDLVTDRQHQAKVLQEIDDAGGSGKALTHFSIKISAAQLQGPKHREIMTSNTIPLEIISLADYQKAQRYQKNLPPLNLQRTQAMYISRDFYLQHVSEQDLKQNQIELAQPQLPKLQITVLSRSYPLGGYLFFDNLLVVSNSVFKKIDSVNSRELIAYQVKNIQPAGKTLSKLDEESFKDQAMRQLIYHDAKKLSDVKMTIFQGQSQDTRADYLSNTYYVRGPVQTLINRSLGIAVFVVGTLGILTTFAWASIFSLRQLTEAQADRYEYLTMKKMGISQPDLNRFIVDYHRFVYLLPVIFGIINGLLIMHVVGGNLDHLQLGLLYILTAVTFVIYGCFHIFTIRRYRRIIEQLKPSEQHVK
ncbi:FtsX-like permease family protein [Lapidilactobacillus mulanensis]|uniref:FtsX-like permease family protein n=1 Tax=Lapidilactobacillus mulanensis TaxID=2485999 RepID=A0ABW4DMC4_9LACO|nr:ABC transporter permease [Lapidilactobacillus mulanensis]